MTCKRCGKYVDKLYDGMCRECWIKWVTED
jgi:NMD protein affecting ribosome stability and mRNA decay